jgi:hypothetical protein
MKVVVAEGKQQVARSAARWFLPRSASELWLRRAMLRLVRLTLVNRTAAGQSTALIASHRQDTVAVSPETRTEAR